MAEGNQRTGWRLSPGCRSLAAQAGTIMAFISDGFERRLAAFERAEAGRFGRPLGDDSLARVSLSRRLDSTPVAAWAEPAKLSRGPAFLLRR